MFGNRQRKKSNNDDQTWQLIDELHALSKGRAVAPNAPIDENPAKMSDPDQSTDALIESLHKLAMAQKPVVQQPGVQQPVAQQPAAQQPVEAESVGTRTDQEKSSSDAENKNSELSTSIHEAIAEPDEALSSAELDDDLSLIEDIKRDAPEISDLQNESVIAKVKEPGFGMGVDNMSKPVSGNDDASAISVEDDDDIIAAIGAMDIDASSETSLPANHSVPPVPPMPTMPLDSVLNIAQAGDSPADPNTTPEPELSVLDDAANMTNADAIRRMVEGNLNEDDIEWLKNGFDSDASRSQLEAGLTGEIANQIKPYLNQLEPHIVEAVENLLEGEFSGDVKKILDESDGTNEASKNAQ